LEIQMSLRAWYLLTTLSVLWGGSFFFNAVILRELSVFGVVFGRVFVGFLVLFVVISVQGHMLGLRQNWKAFLAMGVLNNLIPFSLIVFGQTFIDSGMASIFNATTPFFAVLLAFCAAVREEVSLRKLLGIPIGVAGMCVLFDLGSSHLEWNTVIGGALVIGAAISYALAGIYGRRLTSVAPQISACGMLLFASCLSFPMAAYHDWDSFSALSWEGVGAVTGIGVLSTALAYVLYFRILQIAGAVNLLLVTLLIPVSATILGAFALSEEVSSSEILGMLIIAIGLIVVDGRITARLLGRVRCVRYAKNKAQAPTLK
jgi:drug/metabolite transporter (DMT)-like permease